jgi:uncharacterized membrane protein
MSDEGLGKARMEAISDGVFAVAMTLMLADAVTMEGVKEWRMHWDEKGLLFLVTFGITSNYWIAHNNECRYVKSTDRLVLWLNLLFVAAVAFVPASVSMLGLSESADGKAFTWIYLSNLILMGFSLELWFVSLWRKGFLKEDKESKQRWATFYRNAVLPLAFSVLLVAVWARNLDSLKGAYWWLVDHIRLAVAVPLVFYVLITLTLRSGHFFLRRAMFRVLSLLLILLLISCLVLCWVYPNLLPDLFIFACWLFLWVLTTVFFVDTKPDNKGGFQLRRLVSLR